MDNGFVHICKTGGTTLNETALGSHQTQRLNHVTATSVRDQRLLRHFFLYTIMRNPYDKLISCFNSSSNQLTDPPKDLTFKEYVRYITGNSDRGEITHKHWMPQCWWIKDKEGRVIVDYIGHTETLMESINEIAGILEVPHRLEELHRSNSSAHKERRGMTAHYSQYYDKECRGMAEKYYAEDIEFLKVKFESWPPWPQWNQRHISRKSNKKKLRLFHGIKLFQGGERSGSHPGSGKASQHEGEYRFFQAALSYVKNKDNPIMIEVGSHWALWSLCFRYKFPKGKNILIELNKETLMLGLKNFELNNFSQTFYWGGVFLNSSAKFNKRKNMPNHHMGPALAFPFVGSVLGGPRQWFGPELNLLNIWKQEDLKMVDLLHMDIQGSELSVIRQLEKSTLINKVDVMVIATHSDFIHGEIKNILRRNGFEVKHEKEFNGDQTDGFLIGSKKINKNTKKC